MIQVTERKASELFERGQSILIITETDTKGIRWDNRDAVVLSDIINDWYFESDGELTYFIETQSCTMGK